MDMFLIPKSSYRIGHTKHKGLGVFAARDINAGTVIGDYRGIIMRPEDENEDDDGLYTIEGGKYYDILADPGAHGVHLINHSCANNCEIYPYRGHMLYVAARKIFKGEEITVDYWLGSPDGDTVTCSKHACHCGSLLCTGTMHNRTLNASAWRRFVKKQFGGQYKMVPAPYGRMIPRRKHYPRSIQLDGPLYKNVFGSETKQAVRYHETILPSITELRHKIRTTGQRLLFAKLHIIIDGVRGNELLARECVA